MAPRKAGKRVESDVINIPEMLENNDVSATKKKKIQNDDQLITKEVRLPRAAKNKKLESESISIKAASRQKSAVKKPDSVEKKTSAKNSTKKIEAQVDDTEKVEQNQEIVEKPVKKGRGKTEKKSDIPVEKNHENNKNKMLEEKTSPVIKKGKGRNIKTEVVPKKGKTKKDVENEISTLKSNVKDEDIEKEFEDNSDTRENGVEAESLENGKEETIEEKGETKLIKKGKGKVSAKRGKTVTAKSKVITETNGNNEEDVANESENGIINSI